LRFRFCSILAARMVDFMLSLIDWPSLFRLMIDRLLFGRLVADRTLALDLSDVDDLSEPFDLIDVPDLCDAPDFSDDASSTGEGVPLREDDATCEWTDGASDFLDGVSDLAPTDSGL